MHGVDWSDQKVGSGFRQLIRRRQHEFGNASPVVGVDALHVVGEAVAMHGDFGVSVRAEQFLSFQANGARAEPGALRAAGDDADLERHGKAVLSSQKKLRRPPITKVPSSRSL